MIRASFLSAASYRLGMVISIAALVVSFVPLYFIAGALQPVVAESIRNEGGEYFGFLIVGMSATALFTSAVGAVPSALAANIGNGTLEALLVTRTPLYQLLVGMIGYGILWNGLRAVLLLVGAALIGVHVAWAAAPAALIVIGLLVVAYAAIGLVAAALILVFRTAGPLISAVVAASGLLGGVYYSTSVIPSWLQDLSALIPLTYALRALRMLLLGDASLGAVSADVSILAAYTALLLAGGGAVFGVALRRARASGTLAQY